MDQNNQHLTEKPEVTEERREQAREMRTFYSDEPQVTMLPGSNGTVPGTPVTDWVDDADKGKIEMETGEGNVDYRNTEEFRQKLEQAD